MDEDVETLVVRVRADTQGLSRDVEAMRASLEGPLASGAERAGLRIEQGLLRAVRTGRRAPGTCGCGTMRKARRKMLK